MPSFLLLTVNAMHALQLQRAWKFIYTALFCSRTMCCDVNPIELSTPNTLTLYHTTTTRHWEEEVIAKGILGGRVFVSRGEDYPCAVLSFLSYQPKEEAARFLFVILDALL